MHPFVQQLADHFGVELSNRICLNWKQSDIEDFDPKRAYYDGRTIATRIEIKGVIADRSDHSILHDIAHYVLAKEEQRELPEFGLGTIGWKWWFGKEFGIPSIVDESESIIQEYAGQFLTGLWGKAYVISPFIEDRLTVFDDWDSYLNWRFLQKDTDEKIEEGWQALIRLHEGGLMELPIGKTL